MKETVALRCCKCNFEFSTEITTEEKIYEIKCLNCMKVGGVELDYGKRVKVKEVYNESDKDI